jgi:hypothetical protein
LELSVTSDTASSGTRTFYTGPLRTLADTVREEYLSPEMAEALARAIESWCLEDRYGGLAPGAFAAALTSDLQELSRDGHLIVAYAPNEPILPPPPSDAPRPRTETRCPPERMPFLQAVKFGIRGAEIVHGDVGVVACDFFPPPYEETRARFDQAMDLVKETSGLVLDLRKNRGGHPEMVAYAISYFFDRPSFAITTFKGRHWPEESTRATETVGGTRYGEKRPLAVAVSADTFSGGEEFSYALQALGRARIIGQRTRGGANIGMNFPLPDGFRVFVPQGAPINAITGTNWEGVGVKPDIEAAPSEALEAAVKAVREKAG